MRATTGATAPATVADDMDRTVHAGGTDGTDGTDGLEPGHRSGGARLAGVALIVVAAAFLAGSCWVFWSAGRGDEADLARERDQVMRAAAQQIATLNSMDAGNVDESLRRWLDVSTGPLHDELGRTRVQSRQQIQASGTGATGTVVGAAVTSLDRRAGSARLIASVRIEITRPGVATTVQRKRYEAGLSRTESGWKLTSLTALAAGAR